MEYAYAKEVKMDFLKAIEKTREELGKQGFGILFDIDMQNTLKEKLGIQYDRYMILGTCNPQFAHRALKSEKNIGLLLPCNVIVYEKGGKVIVASILPTVAMNMIENSEVKKVAMDAEKRLRKAIEKI